MLEPKLKDIWKLLHRCVHIIGVRDITLSFILFSRLGVVGVAGESLSCRFLLARLRLFFIKERLLNYGIFWHYRL